MTPHEALEAANAKGRAAAILMFEVEGSRDCGSCGGAMLEFDKRSKLARAAVEMKLAMGGSDCFAMLTLPKGVRTQSANVYQAQMLAFRRELEALGYGKAIKRYWTYID